MAEKRNLRREIADLYRVTRRLFLLILSGLFWGHSSWANQVPCEAQAEEVASRFRIAEGENSPKLVDVEPGKVCQHNANAMLDKRVGKDTMDESSVCRSAYAKLKEAVGQYREKVKVACEKQNTMKDACTAMQSEDPKAAFRCLAENARAASTAQKKAAEALTNAKALAEDLRKQVAAVREKFRRDREQILAAIKQNDADIAAAKAAGDAALESQLTNLANNATGVKDGKLVTTSNMSTLIQPKANELSAQNGGESTITTYRRLLDDNQPRGTDGALIREQTQAKAATEYFNRTADSEITERRQSADTLSRYAQENDNRAAGRAPSSTPTTPVAKSDSTVTGGAKTDKTDKTEKSDKSELPDPKSLSQLASATSGLAGAANNTAASTPAPNMGSLTPGPVSGVAPGAAAPAAPDATKFGDSTPSNGKGNSVVPIGPDSTEPGSPRTRGGGGIVGRSDDFVSGNGDLPVQGRSLTASSVAATGKVGSGGGSGDGIKSDRKLASGDAKSCEQGGACESIEDLKTTQFNPAGSLGMPHIGASDPGFSTVGALDNLFGPMPNFDAATGKPTLPVLGGGGAGGAGLGIDGMDMLDAPGATMDGGGKLVLSSQAAADPMRSLFSRVHGVHERAQRKGAVMLVHRKL